MRPAMRIERGTSIYLALAGAALAAALLVAYDGIDLGVARLFYVPGEGFPADSQSPYHAAIRVMVRVIGWSAGVSLLAALLWRVALGRRLLGVSRQTVIYLFLALALGPGLLVNSILKEYWGRARPSQIVEFGGDKAYTPPLVVADQCAHNCSFVSGDAAVGFVFVALGFAARRRAWRAAGFAAGLGLGSLIGYTRIAQGGHFFSDILFCAVFMLAVAWLLYDLIVRRDSLALLLMLLPQQRGGP